MDVGGVSRPNKPPVLEAAFGLMGSRALALAFNAIGAVIVARSLGATDFGSLSIGMAFFAILVAASSFGLELPLVRAIAQTGSCAREVIVAAIVIRTMALVLAVGAVFGYLELFSTLDTAQRQIIVVVATASAIAVLDVFEAPLFALEHSRTVGRGQVTAAGAGLLAKAGAVYLGAELEWFAWIVVLEQALRSGWAVTKAQALLLGTHVKLSVVVPVIRRQIVEAWPFAASALAVIGYMKIDQIVVGELLGAPSAGAYAVVVKVGEILYFIPVALNQVLFATLVREQTAGRLREAAQAVIDVLMAAAAICACLVIAAAPFVPNVFGSSYESAIGPLMVHALSMPLVFLSNFLWRWNAIMQSQRSGLVRTIIGLAVDVIGLFILLPLLGLYGAVLAGVMARLVVVTCGMVLRSEDRVLLALVGESLRRIGRLEPITRPSFWTSLNRAR